MSPPVARQGVATLFLALGPTGSEATFLAAAEPRIDDVVEDRSEGVAEAEVHVVLVAGQQLPLPQQNFLRARFAARKIDLIARARELAEEVDRESLEQPDAREALDPERVLRRVGEVLTKVELRVGVAPGLAHAQPDLRVVIGQLVARLAEDRLLAI